MQGHSGREQAESLLEFLKTHGVDIADCRGQSYDNASNMSGKYNGMQAIIRQHSEMAHYVPCAAHSLNLVGQSAADCCLAAVAFFNFLQGLYSFFSASTHRWNILNSKLSSKRLPTLKRMSLVRTRRCDESTSGRI